jgi:hypothetical protein
VEIRASASPPGPSSGIKIADDVRVIALYRSSYYPLGESTTSDGPGSSEWLTVARARPVFPNHRQPQVPGELGFYDLRLPDTREDQSELARSHGIHAFCYFEAWGYPDLGTRPFRDVLASGQPGFPFTLCLTIDPSPATKPAVSTLTVEWLEGNQSQLTTALEALRDSRAVKVGDTPVLLVEGLDTSGDQRVSDFLRQDALRVGLPGLFLVARVADIGDSDAAALMGVDAATPIHPNPKLLRRSGARGGNRHSAQATKIPYDDYVERSRLVNPTPLHLQTVLAGWDDTPLNGDRGLVLTDSTPAAYGEWLRSEVSIARDVLPLDRRIVFVASWNDWTRGAHLEPDAVDGRAFLESTRASLASPVWAVDETHR